MMTQAGDEQDCLIPLLTTCVVDRAPRGWIRMKDVSKHIHAYVRTK